MRGLLVLLVPAIVAWNMVSCRTLDEEAGLGVVGEPCLADIDCREGLICSPRQLCVVPPPREWPLEVQPEEMAFPEGLYVTKMVDFLNANQATRTLQPFAAQIRSARYRPGLILQTDAGGAPFILHAGAVAGSAPNGLDFLDDPLHMRALTGQRIEVGDETTFSTLALPERVRPTEMFFLLLRGAEYDIPVPIAPKNIEGRSSLNQARPAEMVLVVDAYILLDHARQVPVTINGENLTLSRLLDPDTQDLDMNRDGEGEGWTLLLEIIAERADF